MRDETGERLRTLARLYGVLTEFTDNSGQEHRAGPQELTAVLKSLGAPIYGPGDVDEAIRHRRDAIASRRIEPVAVAWDGVARPLRLRLPAMPSGRTLGCRLVADGGEERA